MKKLLLASLSLLLSGTMFAQNALKVWSFTDELETMINDYYEPTHPGISSEYKLIPTDKFADELDGALTSDTDVPDVFALEDAFVRRFVEKGPDYLLDLTDIYNSVKDKMVDYPIQVGSYKGKVYAMSWQATPGALFYRRSLAKKYLGTDKPEEVQKYLSDWNKFKETAATLKDKSNGKCVILPSGWELSKPFEGSRRSPWIVKGKLVVDPMMETYLETFKYLKDNGYVADASPWTAEWFAGMSGKLKDEKKKSVEVFSYFLPTWGLHFVLKTNATTGGDWAVVPGPASYRWGGTWVAAYKNSKNAKLAKTLIKYICTDDEFLESWAVDKGDMVSNNTVIDKIKNDFSEPFLCGQNHYKVFAEMANEVDGTLTQATDQTIERLWGDTVYNYVYNGGTKEESIATFKSNVKEELGY